MSNYINNLLQKGNAINITYVMAFLAYGVGDTLTTWIALSQGGRESNPVLAPLGIVGIVVAKILFFILLYTMIMRLNKQGYTQAITFMTGCVFMAGIITIIMNTGVFYK